MSGSVSSWFRRFSSAASARTSVCRLSSADTPSVRRLACAARPGTVRRNVIAPAWATTTSSDDGSGITHRSPVTPARIAASVPCPPSSSLGTRATISSPWSAASAPVTPSALTAPRIAAMPPFMSQAPRPYRWPSRTSPENASPVQVAGSPAGTTSTWPDSTRRKAPGRPARPMTTGSMVRATSSPGQSGSWLIAAGSGWKISTVMPSASSQSARLPWIAVSSPVIERIRTSSARSAVTRSGSTAAAAALATAESRRPVLMRAGPGASGRSPRPNRSRPPRAAGWHGPRSRPPRAGGASPRCPPP